MAYGSDEADIGRLLDQCRGRRTLFRSFASGG